MRRLLSRARRDVRVLGAQALFGLGQLQRRLGAALEEGVLILTYHRVLDRADAMDTWSHPGIVVTEDTFERHVQWIAKDLQPIGLADAEAIFLGDAPLPARACLVTFDDGWVDTAERAWPILRHYRVPATTFLSTGFIGGDRPFWQERLGRLLHAGWERTRRDPGFRAPAGEALSPHGLAGVLDQPPGSVRLRIFELVQARKAIDPAGTETLLAALEALLPAVRWETPQPDRFMTWTQARELAGAGMTFGAHGVTHRLLTLVTPEVARTEIEGSGEAIARELGGRPRAFCYPNGSWNPAVADTVSRCGYALAFSTDEGLARRGAPRHALPRINMHEDMTSTVPLLMSRILGVV